MTQKDFWNLEDRNGQKIFGRRFDGGSIGSVGEPVVPPTPGTPQLPTPSISASSGTVSGSIKVTVSVVPNAVSYTARVYSDAGATVLVSTTTSYVSGADITGLTPGVTYYARVTAIADGVNYTNSNASNIASAVAYAVVTPPSPGFGAVTTTSIVSEYNEGRFVNTSNTATLTVFGARCFAYASQYGSTSSSNRKVKIVNVENSTQLLSIDTPDNNSPADNAYQQNLFILGGVLYLVVLNTDSLGLANSNLYKLNSSLVWELVLERVIDFNIYAYNPASYNYNGIGGVWNMPNATSSAWWGIRYASYSVNTTGGYDEWEGPQFFKLNSDGTYQIFTTPIPSDTYNVIGCSVSSSHIYMYYQNNSATYRAVYDITSGSPVSVENTLISYYAQDNNLKYPRAPLSNGHVGYFGTLSSTNTTYTFGGTRQIFSAGLVQSADYSAIEVGFVGSLNDTYNRSTLIIPGFHLAAGRAGSGLYAYAFNAYDQVGQSSSVSFKTRLFLLRSNLTVDTSVVDGDGLGGSFDPVTNRLWLITKDLVSGSYALKIKYLTVGS